MTPLIMNLLTTILALVSLAQATKDFSWSSIKPTTNLQYHACYDTFECARLQLPLNWLNVTTGTNDTRTVALAIVRLPATVPASDSHHGGTILLNPGGPGGSGVSFMQRFGLELQAIASSGKKSYEMLSFDPRGVAYSTPRVDCYGSKVARESFDTQMHGIGGGIGVEGGAGNGDDERLKRVLGMYDALGGLCDHMVGAEDILPYTTTPFVARDMIAIAEQVEVEKETAIAKQKRNQAREGHHQQPLREGGNGGSSSDKDPVRVNYWGFSYGTILGNTFASMFPGNVGRVVIDGVVDANDYSAGLWLKDLQDTEAIVDYFYDTCYAGGESCALHNTTDKSPDDIRKRVNNFIQALDASPVPYAFPTGQLAVVDGYDIRGIFFRPVYNPNGLDGGFRTAAEILAEALRGNFTRVSVPTLEDACDVAGGTGPGRDEAQAAIASGDANAVNYPHYDLAYWKDYIGQVTRQSPTIGGIWARLRMTCSFWRVAPAWRYDGPFSTPKADASIKAGIPAAPILLTSSRLDPVTPLRNAYEMAKGHPGSRVVMLDGVGHCALSAGWNEEFNGIIARYFDDGTVPDEDTIVHADCVPFTNKTCLWPGAGKSNEEGRVGSMSSSAAREMGMKRHAEGKPLMPVW